MLRSPAGRSGTDLQLRSARPAPHRGWRGDPQNGAATQAIGSRSGASAARDGQVMISGHSENSPVTEQVSGDDGVRQEECSLHTRSSPAISPPFSRSSTLDKPSTSVL